MMAPRIAGLSCCHSPPVLVTAMKSDPKNTAPTLATSNSLAASGDCAAASVVVVSRVPVSSTARPGRNFSVAGLGVASVWMNIEIAPCLNGFKARGWSNHNPKMALTALQVNGPRNGRKSGTGVDIFVAQMGRHQRDWDWKRSGGLGEVRYQGARAFLAGAGGQNQNTDVGVFVDQLDDLFRRVAFANDAVGRDLGDLLCARGKFIERGAFWLLRLTPHEIGKAEPLLIAIARLDHAQHHDL